MRRFFFSVYFLNIFIFCSGSLGYTNDLVRGKIIDNFGHPVGGAIVTFANPENPEIFYTCSTLNDGTFTLELPLAGSEPTIFQNYPNPFSSGTIIPFYSGNESVIHIDIFDITGKKIYTRLLNQQKPGLKQIYWNGHDYHQNKISPGIYICRIIAGRKILTNKMICNGTEGNMPEIIDESVLLDRLQLKKHQYDVTIESNGYQGYTLHDVEVSQGEEKHFVLYRMNTTPYRAGKNYLEKLGETEYEPLFLKGINLGVSVPGTSPGELAATSEQYSRWLEQIASLGFNTIRIYTLHYPRFYKAFLEYNATHPSRQLYLFQGIWLDELLPADNLFSETENFVKEIKEVVDCLHGNRNIEQRYGKAFGEYTADISPWVMGYIIGREIITFEVEATNTLNAGQNNYMGHYFSIQQSDPIEVWITARLDDLVSHETDNYGQSRPVSFSSWPTLDPIEHPTENDIQTDEDKFSFDVTKIINENAPGGIFASYHAYPYYPDFISEDPDYRTFSDALGPNSYIGYLNDLKSHYQGMPLVIAEYGVPTSWGIAHFAHSGMHHGGHDETEQGVYSARLIENIYNARCGGGFYFAWIDEWFKKTWIVEPFGTVYSRKPLWHNVTSAEQNFGLIAFEEDPPSYDTWKPVTGNCRIKSVEADYTSAYFFTRVKFTGAFEKMDTLLVAFDTYRSDLGENLLPDGKEISNRAEFLLKVVAGDISIFHVTEAYNLFGIYHGVSTSDQLYHSVPSNDGKWDLVRWKNNRYEDAVQDIGLLKTSIGNEYASVLHAAKIDNNTVEIRIPWTLLNFVDPSLREVMHDDRSTSTRETTTSGGIALTLVIDECMVETARYKWDTWDSAPLVKEREKLSIPVFSKTLHELPDIPLLKWHHQIDD